VRCAWSWRGSTGGYALHQRLAEHGVCCRDGHRHQVIVPEHEQAAAGQQAITQQQQSAQLGLGRGMRLIQREVGLRRLRHHLGQSAGESREDRELPASQLMRAPVQVSGLLTCEVSDSL
jgi:hypothetical protein